MFLPPFFPAIPFDTAKAALTGFEKKNFYLATGEQANSLFGGIRLVDPEGQFRKPPHTLAMLYLITIFQYVESLPDHLAVQSVQDRTEWKFALHIPLNYPALSVESLCEFRRWLLKNEVAQNSLELLLKRLSKISSCPEKLIRGPKASQVISDICQVNHLALIWEGIHQAMRAVADKNPKWQPEAELPRWYERYGDPHQYLHFGGERLPRHAFIHKAGMDGFYLLKTISKSDQQDLSALPEVVNLGQVCSWQSDGTDDKVILKSRACAGCSVD